MRKPIPPFQAVLNKLTVLYKKIILLNCFFKKAIDKFALLKNYSRCLLI